MIPCLIYSYDIISWHYYNTILSLVDTSLLPSCRSFDVIQATSLKLKLKTGFNPTNTEISLLILSPISQK